MTINRDRILGGFITALLLFGQTVASAHAFEHDPLSANDHCVECLSQSTVDDTAPVHNGVTSDTDLHDSVPQHFYRYCNAAFIPHYPARAPPKIL